MSAQPCGCDPEANWVCEWHTKEKETRMDIDKLFLEIISEIEATKQKIELLRAAKLEAQVDGRALSIAVTHLETSQLWVANARR